MNLRDIIALGQSDQDQEIAAGMDWLAGSDPRLVLAFWMKINDAAGPDMLDQFDDVEARIVRSLALIGFFEVQRAYAEREMGGGD